jgi:hypothetical protein
VREAREGRMSVISRLASIEREEGTNESVSGVDQSTDELGKDVLKEESKEISV